MAIVVGVQSGAAKVKVRADFNKAFAFAQARTWGWNPKGAGDIMMGRTADDNPAAVKALAEPVIMKAVGAEMPKRGLTAAAENPDLTLTYFLLLTVGNNAQTVGQFLPTTTAWALPPFVASTQSLEFIEQGALVLDLSSRARSSGEVSAKRNSSGSSIRNSVRRSSTRQSRRFSSAIRRKNSHSRGMTFSRQILAGLALGILTGLFFGERAAALKWAADGFVKLLQMMVLPYITVSIIASLGSLRPSELRTLGLRAAAVIGGLWLLALSFAFLIPLTFPSIQNASFFSSSLVERRPAVRLHRPLHSREPVQFPGEQRRARRRPVLRHSGRRRWSASNAGSACSTSCRSPGTRSRRPPAS